ncbi:MAG: flagellar brake protein [Pseudomonadota bacterium]
MASTNSEEIVVEETRINQIIRGLASSRTALTLALNDSDQWLNSIVLDVTADRMILDDVVHRGTDAEVQAGSVFSARSRVKGIPVSFSSRVMRIGANRAGKFLECSLPEYLRYAQKRTSYRLSLPSSLRPQLFFRVGEEELEATVRDISEGGAKVLLKGEHPLALGEETSECELLLDESSVLTTNARICHLRTDARRQISEIGLQFMTLQPQERRLLRDWIFKFERQRLRNRD